VSDKEEVLLELYQSMGFSVQTESERYDILHKLVKLGAVKALGTIALQGYDQVFAVKGIGRVGGPTAVQVLKEIAKRARDPDIRQLARDVIMGC